MSFQISDIVNVLAQNNGPERNTLFNIFISTPTILLKPYGYIGMQNLQFLCMNASMPNPQFDTIPVHRYGYGLLEYEPFNTVFNTQTFQFITDAGGYINNFFRDWMRGIMEYSSENNMNGPATIAPNLASPNTRPYLLNYSDNFTSTLQISVFDGTGQTVDFVSLTRAKPINVSDIQFAWGDNDQYVITPVTFAFRDPDYSSSTRSSNLNRLYIPDPNAILEIELLAEEVLADTITYLKY